MLTAPEAAIIFVVSLLKTVEAIANATTEKMMIAVTSFGTRGTRRSEIPPINPSQKKTVNRRFRRNPRDNKNSDVLISAVISTDLLTHLHHVLQRAEYYAVTEGRSSQATNFAQLRKVLCMDARSMKDASATGLHDSDMDKFHDQSIGSKVA